MNMFARFDENPAMTLQDIKETKHYGRTDARMDARTHGQSTWKQYTHHKQTVYPPQTKFAGGITKILMTNGSLMKVKSIAECSPWSILQYFWPALAIIGLEKKFGLLFECLLKTGFSVVIFKGECSAIQWS